MDGETPQPRRDRALKILTLSAVWPNSRHPSFGVFVENRLRGVQETGAASVRVVAPTPLRSTLFGQTDTSIPRLEKRANIVIHHPRYPRPPRVAEALHADLYLGAISGFITRLWNARGPFDLIDAHGLYPDGVAAHGLARRLGVPFVMTARGPDLETVYGRTWNGGPEEPRTSSLIQRRIGAAMKAAAMNAAVCDTLRDTMILLGAEPERVVTLRNGVDLDLFHMPAATEREALRHRLGAPDGVPLLLSVGALIERKRHALAIEAVARTPSAHLRIAGDGPERAALQKLIDQLNVGDRIALLGEIPHRDLPRVYGAADATVLASAMEGCANVVLESLACGVPVIATAVGGTPELLGAPTAGRLVHDATPDGMRAAIEDLMAAPPPHAATRRHAEQFTWRQPVDGVVRMFEQAAGRDGRSMGASPSAITNIAAQ